MVVHSGGATGFKHIGTTSDGLWSKWIQVDGGDETLSVGEVQDREQRQKQKDEWRDRVSKSLLPEERDRLYRAVLSQLSLHPDDYADLQRRGLTDEQIIESGFKSVEVNQPLNAVFPIALPGISKNGRSLTNSQAGYLCPIRNYRGLIVACQVRHRESDSGRYRWLSSDNATAHLPIGELPLAVHRSEISSGAIGLVEGVGSKPFIASQKLGMTIVGASGGQFPSSRQTLSKTLEALNPTEIIFYPDAGAIQNQSVLNQYQSTFTILEEFGHKVQIAWWNQVSKDAPDIDELEDLSKVKLISPKSFWMRCKTIALGAYQSLIKVLGIKDKALKSRAIEMESIELLQLITSLKQEQEVLSYRTGIRAAMFELKIDWNHPAIVSWLQKQGKDRNSLRVRELRGLKERLEAILPKPETELMDEEYEYESEIEPLEDEAIAPLDESVETEEPRSQCGSEGDSISSDSIGDLEIGDGESAIDTGQTVEPDDPFIPF